MKIHLSPQWHIANGEIISIDSEFFRLLALIQNGQSLAKAATTIGISYRHAWGLIKKWEQQFEQQLVIMKKGRAAGTSLSETGSLLLNTYEQQNQLLQRELDKASKNISNTLKDLLNNSQTKTLRFHASHDLAVEHYIKNIQIASDIHIELKTKGSITCLHDFSNKKCELVGFHLAKNKTTQSEMTANLEQLKSRPHRLFLLSKRTQGLMLKPNKKNHIQSIADLTKNNIRFINRQRNSGTRLIFDQLLNEHKINKKDITGYQEEEFTHDAVAAYVAAGGADVGFGNKAAAERFKLNFIPCIEENYYIALASDIDKSLQADCIKELESKDLINKINQLPGYSCSKKLQELKSI